MRLYLVVALLASYLFAEETAAVRFTIDVAEQADSDVELLDREAFRKTLFTRDDQILHLLDGGISAGQHEGGGKSLEIRRFGFNLDHGGVNGGLRVVVDNVPQNHSTQGHGQGYLGSLKTLSPELIGEVQLIDGPFSARHGDFSGLGAVAISLRESMPEQFRIRVQGGNFNSARGFVSWSPDLALRDALVAYEGSYTDGPFIQPLGYHRHNLHGNHTWQIDARSRFGLKFGGGLNSFDSSGQLPLDEVAAGRLPRFGLVSEGQGGDIQMGRTGFYYQRTGGRGDVTKVDGFVERSLFDLYSDFTFFLNDPMNGDRIHQHDSRLSQGTSVEYSRPQFFDWGTGLLTVGGNVLATQTLVELRNPAGQSTSAHARVANVGGFVQESMDFFHRRLEVTGGLRWDVFRFAVSDSRTAAKLQPKAAVSFRPTRKSPLHLLFNYGRGIASLDARGVVSNPGPPIATTDFYQSGVAVSGRRLGVRATAFLIHPSKQLVYIPDDGSIEFVGPSRSYGFQVKSSVRLTRHLNLEGGITKVLNAYLRNTEPRVYIDGAPKFSANTGLTLAGWHGWSGALRMRAINRYRLDGLDSSILAAGHTVFDLAVSRPLSPAVELNLSVDNLLNRHYFETQNYFESRLAGQAPIHRIHGTPGYGTTIAVGLTFRLGRK